MARRPGEHQDSVERHELFRPDQSGQSEHEVYLNDREEDQIFHWDTRREKRDFITGGSPEGRLLVQGILSLTSISAF